MALRNKILLVNSSKQNRKTQRVFEEEQDKV